MSKEKQIEERDCGNCLHLYACALNSEYLPTPCNAYESKAGYRKQSEGEWKIKWRSTFPQYEPSEYQCSICGCVRTVKHKFCPNCGAKMKGE